MNETGRRITARLEKSAWQADEERNPPTFWKPPMKRLGSSINAGSSAGSGQKTTGGQTMGKIIGFFFGLVLVLGVALALFEVDFKPRFPGGSRMENLQAAVLEALGDVHNATENLATEKTLPEESRPEQPPPEQEVVVQQIPAAQPVEKRAEREQPEAPAETLEDTAQAPLDPTDAEPPAPLGGAEIGGQQAEALAPGKTLQVFWKPFETRTSARGFASTINKLTGLEIEVVRQDDDRFVVAYFYNGEEERQQNASLIEESARIKIDLEAGNEP